MSEINLSEMQTEIESNDRDLCLKTALIGTNLFDHLKKKLCASNSFTVLLFIHNIVEKNLYNMERVTHKTVES